MCVCVSKHIYMFIYLSVFTQAVHYTKVNVLEIKICIFSSNGPAAWVIFLFLSLHNNFGSQFCN